MGARAWLAALLLLLAVGLLPGGKAQSQTAVPGGAGYALLFHDNVVVKKSMNNFPSDAITFEAWLSTSDLCHTGGIMSYAKPSMSTDEDQRTKDANHFLIFDPSNVIACHDFEYIDIIPDRNYQSCHAHYNRTVSDTSPTTATFLSRTGAWHHLAVTWSTANRGKINIYQDGLLMATAITDKTEPLVPDGSLMLGGEQDCFGGCTDPHQGYYGFMDEVRIWNRVKTQTEIIADMRRSAGNLKDSSGLIAYWTFDDLGSPEFHDGGITKDESGNGNDLDLLTPPPREDITIKIDESKTMNTGALKFKNSYAMNQQIVNMPTKDISIDFWARMVLGTNPSDSITNEAYAEFLSFAGRSKGDGDINDDEGLADTVFMDDAIRIERYLKEFNRSRYLPNTQVSTLGAISVHINANRQGNGQHADNWVDFATRWTDDKWHHIAVTWEYETGQVKLYFDGISYIPFWQDSEGYISDMDPIMGGVKGQIAKQVERMPNGSLVLGQNQECYGGCFSSGSAYDGDLANVRIWNRVLTDFEVPEIMFENNPRLAGLVMNYQFTSQYVTGNNDRELVVKDQQGTNDLMLGASHPTFQFSLVPLTDAQGDPVPEPQPGPAGYALSLHDEQVLIKENFEDFPQDAITVEFWMWSIDTCRQGVPFSYAAGAYKDLDNAFLVFNYNNWGVSVLEDEGNIGDHNAGFGSTDGRWHHIAVTWDSATGKTTLYDNGRQAWKVARAQGQRLPQGGTLILGREQDCLGGCFDSMYGAIGDVQTIIDMEYGAQDFFGAIDEVRIWKVVRTPEQIHQGMLSDSGNGGGQGHSDYISPNDPNLVAYWKFDEGKGYSVKDETGHGNDLHILEKPDWLVMRWLSSCGDGILEGTEKCDDGNKNDNDGCSHECKVEKGWVCTPTSPSKCVQEFVTPSGPVPSPQPSPVPSPYNPPPVPPYNPPSPSPASQPSGGDSSASARTASGGDEPAPPKHKKSSAGTVALVLVMLLVFVILAAVVYRKREVIYDNFPVVERAVNFVSGGVNKALGRRPGYDGVLSLDPEADMAPSFVDSQPPATYQPGPYTPMPDSGRT